MYTFPKKSYKKTHTNNKIPCGVIKNKVHNMYTRYVLGAYYGKFLTFCFVSAIHFVSAYIGKLSPRVSINIPHTMYVLYVYLMFVVLF